MSQTSEQKSHVVVVVGGGAGGLSVASALLRRQPDLDVAVVEPAKWHFYQPGWTLVGDGSMTAEQTKHPESDHMPDKATWLRSAVTGFDPDNNRVTLENGDTIGYKYLVVATGLKLDWKAVDGLCDTLGDNGVTSNYRFDLAPYTCKLANELTGGNALFTQPAMPIKCAGAPQKALYLTADTFRRRGVSVNLAFYNQGGAMFGVPAYAQALDKVIASYGATPHFHHDLIAVDGKKQKATFTTPDGDVTRDFDMLHVVPPQCAPDVIRNSPLAGDAGWMTVDKNSLRHTRFENVWGLGDCTDTPNAKTAAAVRQQFPVVTGGILHALGHGNGGRDYDGYGACPLTTSRGKVLMAEFRYGGEVVSSFPMDPRVPRSLQWGVKRYFFPWLYWNVMLKGIDLSWPGHKPQPALTAIGK
ncbi:FAD/NAD(P)-binding oxidoreductase [Spectribacter hydrogenoxidans]|uniref:FAD/NAD(P)-binding oxidoreductase n=1 Tax=Spectribacter hydrogenoxidans TaxID=3075608 RepID=A0ABU3BXR9_9GAMM|nr:FAD/NAD(P)-binding oxidoreductase [Salinisphaera sp. W335]MDT0634093.1 FAD/NAD(P)-binding oxidoreductase [Salinisphaera sp. W335]